MNSIPVADASSEDAVLIEDRGPVRILSLNRPRRRNAIDLLLRRVLAEVIEAAMADDGVRAIVVTGRGTTFCSGGDISTMTRQAAADTYPRARAAARVIRAIWDGPTPVVAAVEGAAFGAGLSLALACDRVVAASDAIVSATFAGVGLAGDMGMFASLPARVGPARARQMLMLGEQLSAPAALQLGLIDAMVGPGEALERAVADAGQLAVGPPLALAGIKAMLGRWPADPRQILDEELEMQVRLFDTDDFAEGVAAFAEKRKPTFRGT